ncbi:hypothetical protein, partial [Clostridioides difficile]|uniref:hypothetical protein n=1 Tax=Clostridioides difficile TaxID=1496 RepID=UPI0021156A30
LNYNMNKRLYSLAELMGELVAAEGIFHASGQALATVAVSGSSPKPKGKRKKRKQTGKTGRAHVAPKSGHWKVNCPKIKGTISSFVTETCLAVLPTDSWCVDTGATDHVCNSLQGFQETRALREGEIEVYLGDAT